MNAPLPMLAAITALMERGEYADLYAGKDVDDDGKVKGKSPAILLYIRDILGDTQLNGLSDQARLLGIMLLLITAECEPYGHLTLGACPMPDKHLGKIMGWTAGRTRKAIAELEGAGIWSRRSDGVLYHRRMTRDGIVKEAKDAAQKANGRRGIEGAASGHLGGRGNRKSNPLRAVGGTEIDAANAAGKNPPGGFPETPFSSSSSSSSTLRVVDDDTTRNSEKNTGTGIQIPPEVMDQRAAEVCAMLAGYGITKALPGSAKLRKFIAQGVTLCEFEAIAGRAEDKDKPRNLNYVLKGVADEREAAAKEVIAPRAETPLGGFPPGVIRPAEPYIPPGLQAVKTGPPPAAVRGKIAELLAGKTPRREDAEALAVADENAQETAKI